MRSKIDVYLIIIEFFLERYIFSGKQEVNELLKLILYTL